MSTSAEGYKDKGNEEFKKGNYDKAIEFYTYATEMDPKNHTFYTNRALCYEKMKRYDKALKDADRAISLKSDWAKGHYRRGMALKEMGQFLDAMNAFEVCTRLDKDNQEFKNSFEQAKAALYKGLSPAEILKIEANACFKNGKIQDAITKYSQALDRLGSANDEKSKQLKIDLYANRAACWVQLYEVDKVVADCTAALQLDPVNFKALVRRGQAYETLEKYKKSLEDFEKAAQLEPTAALPQQAVPRLKAAIKKLESF